MTVDEEASNILRMTGGDPMRIHDLLSHQLVLLQTRAQVLVSVAGIVITVTGFSGRVIAGTHILGQVLVVGGLFTVLAAAVYVLSRVMRVRWITGMLTDVSPERIAGVLRFRDAKALAYGRGCMVLAAGLCMYCTAISVMLLNP